VQVMASTEELLSNPCFPASYPPPHHCRDPGSCPSAHTDPRGQTLSPGGGLALLSPAGVQGGWRREDRMRGTVAAWLGAPLPAVSADFPAPALS
jgi:hypothetical protein